MLILIIYDSYSYNDYYDFYSYYVYYFFVPVVVRCVKLPTIDKEGVKSFKFPNRSKDKSFRLFTFTY